MWADLQFAAGRWLHLFCHFAHACRIEIQSGHGIVALWLCRFFLDGYRFSVRIEIHDTETLRIVDIIAKDGCLSLLCILCGIAQNFSESVSIENVVTKYHGAGILSDKFLSKQKCLCESIRRRLHFVGQMKPELISIPQKCLKSRGIFRRGNN